MQMVHLTERLTTFLSGHIGISDKMADILGHTISITSIIAIGIGINWLCQIIFTLISRHNIKLIRSKWLPFLTKRRLGRRILLLIPGLIMYMLPYFFFEKEASVTRILHRADIIFMLTVMIAIGNSILLAFLDFYSTTEKNRSHPLQGLIQALQVILYFIGGIIIVAILIDKSPTVLLTGLGASAAVLMLIFKDSILGFVAGVQLSQNDMVRLGDWIQLPDGSANGNVEEITLNTVKVRNWDNTISMIPPYTLVTTTFKNWRGMQESAGRRADKCIFIDLNSLESYSQDMVLDLRKNIPLMSNADLRSSDPEQLVTNIGLYRTYIEIYLRTHPEVNHDLDIIVRQQEATAYGVPVEVYFFLKDKSWASFEKKQSDIFDHIMVMAHEFGLRLYQRP